MLLRTSILMGLAALCSASDIQLTLASSSSSSSSSSAPVPHSHLPGLIEVFPYPSCEEAAEQSHGPPPHHLLEPNDSCVELPGTVENSVLIMRPALCEDGSTADLVLFKNRRCAVRGYRWVPGAEVDAVFRETDKKCLGRVGNKRFGSMMFWCAGQEKKKKKQGGHRQGVDDDVEEERERTSDDGGEVEELHSTLQYDEEAATDDTSIDDPEDNNDDDDQKPVPDPGKARGNNGGSILSFVMILVLIIAISILSCAMAILKWSQFLTNITHLFRRRDGAIVLD